MADDEGRNSRGGGRRKGSSEEARGSEELRPSDFVERIVSDPSEPAPALRVLEGLLGRSDKEGYWRLYSSNTLQEYAEFNVEDVLYSEQVPKEQSGLGLESTRVFLAEDAEVEAVQPEAATTGMGVGMEGMGAGGLAGQQFGAGAGAGAPFGAGAGAPFGAGMLEAGGAPLGGGVAEAGVGAEAPPNDYWEYVNPGESLWSIAQKWFGDGNWWRRIWYANRVQIPNPNLINVGTYVRVPFGGFYYRIHQGDTLWGIAEAAYRDGSQWRRIWNRNRPQIPNPNFLQVGLNIYVP